MVESKIMEDTRGGGGGQFISCRVPQYFTTRSTQTVTDCCLNVCPDPFDSLYLVTSFVGLKYDKSYFKWW